MLSRGSSSGCLAFSFENMFGLVCGICEVYLNWKSDQFYAQLDIQAHSVTVEVD